MEHAMGRACRTNGERRNAYRVLVGNQEGKRPLGRPRCRWADNIKMDLRKDEVVWNGLIRLRIGTGRRLVNAVIIFEFHKTPGNC
jgi:hypothetical protein